MNTIYAVYLTIYNGEMLPPFYIGSTSLDKLNRGYCGSVSSREYKTLWKAALKQEPENFDTIVISEHNTRKEALDAECDLQRKLDVVKSPLFVNKAIATLHPRNSGKGRKMSAKTLAAIIKSRTGSTHTDEAKLKMSIASQKRLPATAESRAKMSTSQKSRERKPMTAEAKENLSIKQTGKQASQETKNKLSETLKEKCNTEEAKKRLSAAANKRWEIYRAKKLIEA